MHEYERQKTSVAEIEADHNKAASGNKAAGTRVRKQAQEILKNANLLCIRILKSVLPNRLEKSHEKCE
jgi:hypothetical protein